MESYGEGNNVNGLQPKILKSKDKDRLKATLKEDVTDMFKAILDFVEASLGDPGKFGVVRKKILRVANDTIRSMERELDMYYSVKFITGSANEDIITVKRSCKKDE